MALRVWLPLNGNLNNQGIDKLTISGTPTFINGKIGQCLSLTSRITFNQMSKLDKFTILFWLKVDSCASDWADSLGFKSVQADGTSASDFRFEATKTTRACSFHNNTPYAITQGSQILITEAQKGEWHHCGVSYDGTKLYTYIDGVLTFTDTGLGGYLIDRFHIGETNNMVGGMNDLRIYDECLSDKMIKEISKGLVAHYRLSGNGAENLYPFSSSWSANGGSNTLTKEKDNRTMTITYNVDSPSSASGRYLAIHTWLTAGKTYIVSADIKSSKPMNLRFGFESNATTLYTSDVYKRYTCKYTCPDTVPTWLAWIIYTSGDNSSVKTGDSISITNIKFEEENLPTPWKPNVNDILYKQLGYDKIIAQDCSGYEYNGKIDGTLKAVSDSCRYETSVNFNAPGYLHYLTSPINVNTDAFTYSVWFKPDRNATMALYNDRTVVGGGFSLFYLDGSFRFDTGVNNQMQATNAVPTLNQWNHVVVTFNKTTGKKVYLNGELKNSTTNPGELSTIGQYASIGNSSTNGAAGAGNQIYGNLSDARIYCTELSAEDILTLYKNSGIIDNKGNTYFYDFYENEENKFHFINDLMLGKKWVTGISSVGQAKCTITLTDDGYRIYRVPNTPYSSSDSSTRVMWGGLRLQPLLVDPNLLKKNHTYIILYDAKGQTTQGQTEYGWSNNMGWGGGGLNPTPTAEEKSMIPANFQSDTYKTFWYKWTLSDDIRKVCTSSYSSFVQGTEYLSYRDFQVGWPYGNTGELGTDIYIRNFRLYDITENAQPKILKNGIFKTLSFDEKDDLAKIRKSGNMESPNFIEI